MLGLLKEDKGITLIEIILSVAILAIIVTPLYSLFVNASKTNEKAEDILIAANDAQGLVEQKKAGIEYPADITSGFSYEINEENVDDYSLESNASDFDVTIELEKKASNEAYINENSTTIHNVTEDEDFDIVVYQNKVVISNEGIATSDINLVNDGTVKIAVKSYGDVDINLEVTNNPDNNLQVYIYKAKMKDSTSVVSVIQKEGEVKVRAVSNLEDSEFSGKDMLTKINVKVSNEDSYTGENDLIEITTLDKD